MTRRTYTTELVRADDLKSSDVILINGTWSWVSGAWDQVSQDTAAEEFGDDSPITRKIRSIVNTVPDNGEGVYVAVRYLATNVSSGMGPEFRYSPDNPAFRIAAYSQYELLEVQKEILP